MLQVYDVLNFDMILMLRLPYVPGCCQWVYKVTLCTATGCHQWRT
jgi:hypothetical protein